MNIHTGNKAAAMLAAGLGMIGSMFDAPQRQTRSGAIDPRYFSEAKPKQNPAGSKRVHMGMGSKLRGLGVIKGVTISPKKDIGKGPAQTLSVRDRQLLTGSKSRSSKGSFYADRRGHLLRTGAHRYL